MSQQVRLRQAHDLPIDDAVTAKSPNDRKPLLDENSFEQLLEAAFVIQQHNDSLRAAPQVEVDSEEILETEATADQGPAPAPTAIAPARPDHTQTLSEIVATQHQIQMSHLNLEEAMDLIADSIQRIANASGAAIGLVEGEELVYRAASGSAAGIVGTRAKASSCLTSECLMNGATLHCADVTKERGLDVNLCRARNIRSLIAVPIYYEGKTVGSVELHFASPNVSHEQDVRTCQLMAGLVTEAKARADELEWKQALAAERATMLEALEKLKPQLQQLASEPEPLASSTPAVRAAEANGNSCSQCGNTMDDEQIFCGVCGTERTGFTPAGTQSKAASLWPMSETQAGPEEEISEPWPGTSPDPQLHRASDLEMSLLNETPAELAEGPVTAGESHLFQGEPLMEQSDQPPAGNDEEVLAVQKPGDPWTSANKAKSWLESVRGIESEGARFWKAHRADVYLACAVLILIVAAVGWVIRSNSATSASAGPAAPSVTTKRRPVQQDQKLTLLDQLMITLGLAEAPPAQPYTGNPDTKVWVDLHTALYYCPGTDLYGKTPKGKFTTQRDAQLDQFEPAYRKACD
jgi:putative methionine-R-sulfoxide reductase with GAF domain